MLTKLKTPRVKLTDEIADQIVEAIRKGAFELVAAQAAGVPESLYAKWMTSALWPHQLFRRRVLQARAEARRDAEQRVFKADPKLWLKSGPGREKVIGDRVVEGWTDAPPATTKQPEPSVNMLVNAAGGDLTRTLLAALEPYPEARVAVAAALCGDSPTLKHPPLKEPAILALEAS